MRLPIVGLLLLCLAACASPQGQSISANPEMAAKTIQTEYRLNPGDVLDLKFFYNPELNENVMVRPDGRISLQLANEIMAAGLTTEELRKSLVDRYRSQINKPEIAVIVRTFSTQRVYVDGEVFRPGILPLMGPISVQQAIAAAGGFKETARRTDVLIIRKRNGKPVPLKVNMEAALSYPTEDTLLAPFDIVYVPRSAIGEVNKFVDLYIRRNLPIGAGVGFGFNQ